MFSSKLQTPKKTLKTFLSIFKEQATLKSPQTKQGCPLTTPVQHSFGLINSYKHEFSFSGVTANIIGSSWGVGNGHSIGEW